MSNDKICLCPVRPMYTIGSMGSGSVHEMHLMDEWNATHAHHPYAKARDELAKAMQNAEKDVRSGAIMWRMAHEVMGLPVPPEVEAIASAQQRLSEPAHLAEG